jgi:hypothetical protein
MVDAGGTMRYRVIPIPTQLTQRVRESGKAPGYGHAAERSIAGPDGYGPCRHCLRRTREGEGRLLFNYNPYHGMDEVPVVGPIFVHEQACEPYREEGFPTELRGLPLVAQGHFLKGAGLLNQVVDSDAPEHAIESLLNDPQVAFITLRNAEAGCFVARVERG